MSDTDDPPRGIAYGCLFALLAWAFIALALLAC